LHCFRRYRPVRFVVHPLVDLKRRRRVKGYTVTELSTLYRVSGGRTVQEAIANSREKMRRYTTSFRLLKMLRDVRRDARRMSPCG
jgi:hypothetical protein